MSDGVKHAPEPVLLRDGGVQFVPAHDREPLEAWSELMDVVEALCPQWPVRAPARYANRFRL